MFLGLAFPVFLSGFNDIMTYLTATIEMPACKILISGIHSMLGVIFYVFLNIWGSFAFWPQLLNPLNPAGRFSGLRKQGPRNPAGRFSGICYGVSKTRRAFKPAHVRLIIKWFVYTGRYQATLRSQVESSSLFSFLTICNLLTGFCTRYTNLRRKYGRDTQVYVKIPILASCYGQCRGVI